MFVQPLGTKYTRIFDTGSSTSTAAADKKGLGRDAFLTLLITQLKHQDPLNPLEGTEFTAQLAEFSSLEELFGLNQSLKDIQETLCNHQEDRLISYIGKTVKVKTNKISVDAGEIQGGSYTLEQRAEVTLFIYDSNGMEVRRVYSGKQEAGEHDLSWDGRNSGGHVVEDGTYTLEVEARDENGFPVPCDVYLTGEVSGVTYREGAPYLMVGDRLEAPEDIVEITKGTESL